MILMPGFFVVVCRAPRPSANSMEFDQVHCRCEQPCDIVHKNNNNQRQI